MAYSASYCSTWVCVRKSESEKVWVTQEKDGDLALATMQFKLYAIGNNPNQDRQQEELSALYWSLVDEKEVP